MMSASNVIHITRLGDVIASHAKSADLAKNFKKSNIFV